jgi:hypothetical protein
LIFEALLAALVVLLFVAYLVERRLGTRVVVTTLRGESIRGTRRLGLLKVVLTDAEVLADGVSTALSGRVEIPRRNVALIQVLPAAVQDARQTPAGPVSLPPPVGRAGAIR